MPTRLNRKPLGHANFKEHNLEKQVDLINRTEYGLGLSLPGGGHQRWSSMSDRHSTLPPSGMIANWVLDGVSRSAEPGRLSLRSLFSNEKNVDLFTEVPSLGAAWLDVESFKKPMIECLQVYPTLDFRLSWRLSDCASMLQVRLSMRWSWSEDFLCLSASTAVLGLESTLRIRSSKAIKWRVDRNVEIPVDALQANSILIDESIGNPLAVMLEPVGQMCLRQGYLTDRLCGEVQLQYQVAYCKSSRNLTLRLMSKLTPLKLQLKESHLTLGQLKHAQILLPESFLFGVEFKPHG